MRFRGIALFVLVCFMAVPLLAAAQTATEDIDKVIERTTKRRDTPTKVAAFKDKLREYYYLSGPAIEDLSKDFSTGESLAIASMASISSKDVKEVARMKKEGLGWPQIAEQVGVQVKDVIKDIRKFQRAAG